MSNYTNLHTDQEILRLAEQERGKAMVGFFRSLFVKRDHHAGEHTADAVAAE
jgi:hypothetical protein